MPLKIKEIWFDAGHIYGRDENISFESFAHEDTEPTPLQRFFLTHKEINEMTIIKPTACAFLYYCSNILSDFLNLPISLWRQVVHQNIFFE